MDVKPQGNGTIGAVMPLVIQTGTGVAILLASWYIISILPMLDDIQFPLQFSLSELLTALILTILIWMLGVFGRRLELRLGFIHRDFPQGGTIIKYIIYLFIAVIGYHAYAPLALPYLDDYYWIYSLVFLVLSLSMLALLGFTVYSNTESISAMFSKTKKAVPVQTTGFSLCAKCGKSNKAGSKFCVSCGEVLSSPAKVNACNTCGAALKAGAKFCTGCGQVVKGFPVDRAEEQNIPAAVIHKEPADSSTPPDTELQDQEKTCSNCGAVLKEKALFCTSCGNSVQ